MSTMPPPGSLLEQAVAGIWAEVLQLEQVGLHQDFFELGGHSITATQVLIRIHAAFGIDLPLRTLFESTVSSLTTVIAEHLLAQPRDARDAVSANRPTEVHP